MALINKYLPIFYRELLQYFQELKSKTKTNIFPYVEYIIWNNKAITIENHSFWKSWFGRGICFLIQDILNPHGNVLTVGEFQSKFEIKINYVHYFQLIAAIPPDLKRKAKAFAIPPSDSLTSTNINTLSAIDLTTMRCKNYYNLFNAGCVFELTGIKKWRRKFPLDFIKIGRRNLLLFTARSSKGNKLRQFSFRLLHRIIVSNKELKKLGFAG